MASAGAVKRCQNPRKDDAEPFLAIEHVGANDGWVQVLSRSSAAGGGAVAHLYRVGHPAILGHRDRGLTPTTLLFRPTLRIHAVDNIGVACLSRKSDG